MCAGNTSASSPFLAHTHAMWQLKSRGMTEAWLTRDGLPVWLAALVLAAVAPWFVRLFAKSLERRMVRRTRNLTDPILADNNQIQGGEG